MSHWLCATHDSWNYRHPDGCIEDIVMLKLHDDLIAALTNCLTLQDFNPVVIANHRLYARAFLDYLAECKIEVEAVTPAQVDLYLVYARQDFEAQHGRTPSARWHMLPRTSIDKVLRLAQGTWPPKAAMVGPDARHRHMICDEYENWLRDERGLASASIAALMWEARSFLRWQFDRGGADSLHALGVVDIDLYMDLRALGLRRKSLADVAERLRSFMRHLHRTGRISSDLAHHIVAPMLYAYENVPSALNKDQITRVLAETKRDESPRGLRDHAILELLATYGLRQGEICRLRLDDVNWRGESFQVRHTKTGAQSLMPLLVPVGNALLKYLRHGRPAANAREIFIRSCAPYQPMTSLYGMIRGRLAAAGIELPGKRGPHIFRHARAVEMLRALVPQKIIGDVLGHRSTKSIDAYLKLATDDLRAVALDVPGSAVLS
jgi:site-specific recombinase XerD